MRSECQFFMSVQDEREFIEHAASTHSLAVAGRGHVAALTGPLGSIQFLRSELIGSTLTAGRIALATVGLDVEPLLSEGAAPRLERIFRQLRHWLQTRYTNDLVAFSEALPPEQRKVIRYPSFWLGPDARRWLLSHPDATLRQFRTVAVIFIPLELHATGTT